MEHALRNRAICETRADRWAERWGRAGAAAWAGIAVLARIGIVRIGIIELLFLFAPLVIVPLGMELGRGRKDFLPGTPRHLAELAQILQPLGAALTVHRALGEYRSQQPDNEKNSPANADDIFHQRRQGDDYKRGRQ